MNIRFVMEFLNILAVILIAFAACTGLIITTEVLCSLYFLIKNRVMPILGGKGKQQKIIEMMTKDKKTETPTYEELKHENEMLRKERLCMKAHINRLLGIIDTHLSVKNELNQRLLGIMDTLLSVKNELERKLMIRPQSSAGAVGGSDQLAAIPNRNDNANLNTSI